MIEEPVPRHLGRGLERAGFFKQMRGPGYHFQTTLTAHEGLRLSIQVEHSLVVTAHYQ